MKKVFLSILLALCGLGFSRESNAFNLVVPLRINAWHASEITFHINPTNCGLTEDQLNGYLDSALALWNGIPTANLKLLRGAKNTTTTYATASAASNAQTAADPVIFCDPSYTSHGGTASVPASEGLKTFSTAANTVDFFTIGDYITLNLQSGAVGNIYTASPLPYGDNTYILLLAHEIGHVLGLGHSNEPESIMSYSHAPYSSDTAIRLGQDDADGITYLYPRTEVGAGGKIFGCDAQAADGTQSTGTNWASFFEFLSILFLAWFSTRALKSIRNSA